VLTDLFAVASGMPPETVEWAIPPACRRGIDPPPRPVRDGPDAVFEFPEWRPRGGARHLVAAFSAVEERGSSFRFELSVRVAGAWSAWVGAAPIGAASFPPIDTTDGALASDIDLWRTSAAAERVRLRLRVRSAPPGAVLTAPWLVTLSACDLAPVEPMRGRGADVAELAVPPLSQHTEGGALGARICSPTSVAMVLAYWRAPAAVDEIAADAFHAPLDLYGVWPAAIAAAARRGVPGYLLRFPDWTSAAWCLARGVPIVASVRYARSELTGAAIDATEGHLLVLTGVAGDGVLVNDPAAPDAATVRRRYRRDEIERVWLERAGIGYVLFRPNPPRS
jgi:hypothetical protein